MFFTRPLLQATTKLTTGLTGIPVHPNPRPHLIQTYNTTLSALSRFPEHAVYRQATEGFTKTRLAIVEANENVNDIEAKIGCGQIEQLICKLKTNSNWSANGQWKPWEQLETPIPEGQWKYPGNKE
ncbi:unnamed protein product [Absidia cylindrospora]